MPTVNRTVVMIHPGGLGDVLLATQAMVRLRTRFPNHRLVLCAEDHVARLLLACRIVDEWTSVQGRDCADLFAGVEMVTGQLRIWLEDCDLAIGWAQDLDGKLTETMKSFGVREVILCSPFSITVQATHQCDRFLETIGERPSEDEGAVLLMVTEPILKIGWSCLESVGLSTKQSLVILHPGSGSVHKCVAPEVLAPVIHALQSIGATPVILEGPTDREQVEWLLRSCRESPIVLRNLDIRTAAGVLAHAQLFVGQDSGMTHLAGLIGVRVVALFGPTDPARWAPRGPHVTVVQGPPCLCRSWGEVSRCERKPCLEIQQDHLVACCVAGLKETAVQ